MHCCNQEKQLVHYCNQRSELVRRCNQLNTTDALLHPTEGTGALLQHQKGTDALLLPTKRIAAVLQATRKLCTAATIKGNRSLLQPKNENRDRPPPTLHFRIRLPAHRIPITPNRVQDSVIAVRAQTLSSVVH